MPSKSLAVQMSDEDRLYRRYWSGNKGESMGVSRRQLGEKIDRLKSTANGILRHVRRLDLPTSKEIKEGDVWDEESMEEMNDYLTECFKTLMETEKEVNRLTKPFRNDARPPYQKPDPIECPKCSHKFTKKGRNKNEDL